MFKVVDWLYRWREGGRDGEFSKLTLKEPILSTSHWWKLGHRGNSWPTFNKLDTPITQPSLPERLTSCVGGDVFSAMWMQLCTWNQQLIKRWQVGLPWPAQPLHRAGLSPTVNNSIVLLLEDMSRTNCIESHRSSHLGQIGLIQNHKGGKHVCNNLYLLFLPSFSTFLSPISSHRDSRYLCCLVPITKKSNKADKNSQKHADTLSRGIIF